MKRYAIVTNARSLTEVEAYLPANYEVVHVSRSSPDKPTQDQYLIQGEDKAGWTLDDYVIPRFASGLIWANETDPIPNADNLKN